MSFFQRLLGRDKPKKECPRCLGKGHVEWSDIKRLNQELKWTPGTCAYCNGVGKVTDTIEKNVAVDSSYLVIDLPEEERERIIQGHPEAFERGMQFEDQIKTFIDQISYLHFKTGLKSEQIAEFFLVGEDSHDSYESRKLEYINYIKRVIEKSASKH
jgi:excinuclease UvrABC ATPase subunit